MDEQLGRARRSASKLRHLAAHAEADATRPGPAGAALAAPGGLAVWEWRATEGGAGVGPWQRCVAEVAEELEAAAAGLPGAGSLSADATVLLRRHSPPLVVEPAD